MRIYPASDRSLLVAFGSEISFDTWRRVHHLTQALLNVRGILNLHPAYASVLIDFDPRRLTHQGVEELVRSQLAVPSQESMEEFRRVEILVRFGGEAGPDLTDVALHAGLSPEQVIEVFTGAAYVVYFVGFSTCFPYLGGLPAQLVTPRLPVPRKNVPAGAVAIGGAQAGVYPLASPGGWRLIGHTAIPLFDPESSPPALLRMGDRVRFVEER